MKDYRIEIKKIYINKYIYLSLYYDIQIINCQKLIEQIYKIYIFISDYEQLII